MASELSSSARDVIYKIRHVIRGELLDDDLALRHACALLVEPVMGVSPAEEYEALLEALRSDERLSTWRGDPRVEQVIDEEEFRSHLRRVVAELDSMRPWSVPLYRALDAEKWQAYTSFRSVGAIYLRPPDVEDRIHIHMSPAARLDGDGRVRVVLLELRSGHEIAIVGRWWPDAPDVAAVLTRDPDVSASDVMAELTSEGHFEPGEVDVLH